MGTVVVEVGVDTPGSVVTGSGVDETVTGVAVVGLGSVGIVVGRVVGKEVLVSGPGEDEGVAEGLRHDSISSTDIPALTTWTLHDLLPDRKHLQSLLESEKER